MKIDRPIFLIGSGRSGKSLLGNFLAIHKDTCWFSNYTDRFPLLPQFAFINRLTHFPLIGRIIKRSIISHRPNRYLPKPVEGQKIYHSYCQFAHSRYVTEADLTPYQIFIFKKVVENHVKFQGRSRFINDQSANTQRLRQVAKIFPNAFFIHVIRDGRAVANELIQGKFDYDIWWFGNKPHVWNESGKEPIILCGLDWKHNVKAILESVRLFEDRYLEIRYEDLTSDTTSVVQKVLEFCQLDRNDDFATWIPRRIKSQNYRWRRELTSQQIDALNQELSGFLSQLEYS
jgi:Sulfotransferase family